MILMNCYIYLLFLICLASADRPKSRNYKISMVSSEQDPRRPAKFLHGESPVWDPARKCLFFVDVRQQNVHRLDYNTGKIHTKHISYGQVNVVSLVAESSRLLVAVRSALYLLDWLAPGDSALRLLTTVDQGLPSNVINEGKPDFAGRFCGGTKGPQDGDDVTPDKATFYRIEQENFMNPRVMLRPISISNGLVWSLNNSVLFYIDSATKKVEAFDFNLQSGDISGRRTIIDITQYGYDDDAIPDGMTIDSQGNLWVAIMYGGAVLHVDPDSRQVLYVYKLPVSHVTSVMWGGPELDELFVTTSAYHVNSSIEPLAGAIFTLRDTGYCGLPQNSFRFDNATFY